MHRFGKLSNFYLFERMGKNSLIAFATDFVFIDNSLMIKTANRYDAQDFNVHL